MISSSSQAKGAPLRECEERVVRIYLQMCEVKEDVLVKMCDEQRKCCALRPYPQLGVRRETPCICVQLKARCLNLLHRAAGENFRIMSAFLTYVPPGFPNSN
jgi:hypothetical protein